MATADDSKLLQLAAEPAQEVFLVLERPRALLPLLVLLAVLPGLFALQYRSFSERDALWALRSLQVATAGSIESVVDPGADDPQSPLRWQPPLGSWLTRGLMWLLGTSETLALYIVPYLSAVATVAMTYLLLRRLFDARLGLIAAALLACHGPFLAIAQSPGSYGLAVLLALVSFWGFLAHLQEAAGIVSLKLLISGIGLGLCLLAGGSVALVAFAVLLAYALGLRGESLKKRRDRPAEPRRVWVGWPALKSLGVLGLTAFAVGGWWTLMMSSRYGGEFLSEFLTRGMPAAFNAANGASPRTWLESGALAGTGLLGVLSGFAVFGVGRSLFEAFTAIDESRRQSLQFLSAWATCGLMLWLVQLDRTGVGLPGGSVWDAFLMVPCIALAAWFIDEAARRRLHVVMVAAAVCVTLAAVLIAARAPGGDAAVSAWQSLTMALWLAVLVIAAVWISGLVPTRDARLRLVLSALLLAHLAAHPAMALRLVRTSDPDDRALASFRESLRTLPEVETCLIIRQRQLPSRLRFTLRSLWPRADVHFVENWDAALSEVLAGSDNQHEVMVLDWAPPQLRPANLQVPGLLITQISTPYFFEGRELRTYLIVRESQNREKSA